MRLTRGFVYTSDHWLIRWFALFLEETVTVSIYQFFESPPSTLLPQLSPLAAIFIYFYFFTHKAGNVLTKTDLICYTIFLFADYSRIFCVFLNCINIISSMSKRFISLFVF